MAKVDFKRVSTNAEVDNIEIKDGQFIVTGEGKSFVDFGSQRKSIAGTPDTTMSDTSTNSVENKVIKEYVDNKINNLKKVVWTNPNPNSNMPNNTIINLLSDDYDILEIFYKYTTSNNTMWSKKIIKGYSAYLEIATPYYTTSNQVANEYRLFTRNSDTQYTVSHCNITYTSNTSTTREDFIIPIYIVGYKTGLFS